MPLCTPRTPVVRGHIQLHLEHGIDAFSDDHVTGSRADLNMSLAAMASAEGFSVLVVGLRNQPFRGKTCFGTFVSALSFHGLALKCFTEFIVRIGATVIS